MSRVRKKKVRGRPRKEKQVTKKQIPDAEWVTQYELACTNGNKDKPDYNKPHSCESLAKHLNVTYGAIQQRAANLRTKGVRLSAMPRAVGTRTNVLELNKLIKTLS